MGIFYGCKSASAGLSHICVHFLKDVNKDIVISLLPVNAFMVNWALFWETSSLAFTLYSHLSYRRIIAHSYIYRPMTGVWQGVFMSLLPTFWPYLPPPNLKFSFFLIDFGVISPLQLRIYTSPSFLLFWFNFPSSYSTFFNIPNYYQFTGMISFLPIRGRTVVFCLAMIKIFDLFVHCDEDIFMMFI